MSDELSLCATVGNPKLLAREKIGLFCSVHCPGKLALRMYDLVRDLRDAGITLVGGFHSPMEQECLRLVLRGGSPVIVCPARSVQDMRLPPEWKEPLKAGRLLLISPFPMHVRRVTHATAMARNDFVASLADILLVAHANPGGSTEHLCRAALDHAKRVLTFSDRANQHLVELGVQPIRDTACVLEAIGHGELSR